MSITVDEQTSVMSFMDGDLRRLEQVLVDSLGKTNIICEYQDFLGVGSLYNIMSVVGSAVLLNDFTYRNHLAPRLNQLALVLFDSTRKRLIKNGTVVNDNDVRINVDSESVRMLPITRKELCKCNALTMSTNAYNF